MSDYLFVYGTLMSGFDNPFAKRLATQSTPLSQGSFPGYLYRIDWFPGAVYFEACDSLVHGEVVRMSSKKTTLHQLDEYEEVTEDHAKSLYIRRKVPVKLTSGSVELCWTYLYNQEIHGLERIVSGNFKTCHHITS